MPLAYTQLLAIIEGEPKRVAKSRERPLGAIRLLKDIYYRSAMPGLTAPKRDAPGAFWPGVALGFAFT